MRLWLDPLNNYSDNVEENKVQTKKRGAKGKGGGGGRRKKAQKCWNSYSKKAAEYRNYVYSIMMITF